MEENINYTQMDGCSIEKLCPILSDVFEQDITSETMITEQQRTHRLALVSWDSVF